MSANCLSITHLAGTRLTNHVFVSIQLRSLHVTQPELQIQLSRFDNSHFPYAFCGLSKNFLILQNSAFQNLRATIKEPISGASRLFHIPRLLSRSVELRQFPLARRKSLYFMSWPPSDNQKVRNGGQTPLNDLQLLEASVVFDSLPCMNIITSTKMSIIWFYGWRCMGHFLDGPHQNVIYFTLVLVFRRQAPQIVIHLILIGGLVIGTWQTK